MTDFATYQPPAVYVDQQATSIVPSVGVAPSVVAIVGPSIGYRTATQTLTLNGTTATALAQQGINTTTIVVRSIDGASTYTVSTDYAVATTVGPDTVASTPDDGTTIARVGGGDIADGETVLVSYQYTDTVYRDPVRVTDYDSVREIYGEAFDASSAVVSPLSLAAKLAMDNGARELVLVADAGSASTTSRANLSAALAKIEGIPDIAAVVVLPVGLTGTTLSPGDIINIGTDLSAHCTNASADGNYRYGFYGVHTKVTIPPEDIAAGISDERVVFVWPNSVSYYDSPRAQTVQVPGFYLAAAVAGLAVSVEPQMPLTLKQVFGLSGLSQSVVTTMTKSAKDTWSQGGVAVVQLTRQRQLMVRHGVTTSPSTTETRELSMVRARDTLMSTIEDSVNVAGLIGSFIESTTPLRVKSVVQGVLEASKSSRLINDYRDLKARLRPGDPQVLEVRFQYLPSWPLNYIDIIFNIDTASGVISDAGASVAA